MCEANAYWLRDGRESLLMESVDVVEQLVSRLRGSYTVLARHRQLAQFAER